MSWTGVSRFPKNEKLSYGVCKLHELEMMNDGAWQANQRREGNEMKAKCGVEYESGAEKPDNARFALWYLGHVKFFVTREEAEKALEGLTSLQKEDASISELEK